MINSSHLLRAGAVLALLSFTAIAGAAQWKWIDLSGHVQYSDRPPPSDIPEKNILQHPPGSARAGSGGTVSALNPSSAPASSASAPSGDPELEARRRKEQEAQDAAKKAADEQQAKIKADNCAQARNYQRTLDSGIRIARVNANGEREVLDDDARAKEAARTREAVRNNCTQ